MKGACIKKFDNYLKYRNLSFFMNLGLDLALILKLELNSSIPVGVRD